MSAGPANALRDAEAGTPQIARYVDPRHRLH